MPFIQLGDSAVVIALGDSVDADTAARVQAVTAEIERHRPAGVVDIVPAFASVAVFYDATQSDGFETLTTHLETLVARAEASVVSVPFRTVEIPVCYGGEYGPDLTLVSTHTRLSPAEVIARHTAPDYVVHAVGFVPGFPYLGGLPAELATPRRSTPRPRVPAGSVGIGGAQTGAYPLVTPGGWNVIGRTPLRLFDAARADASLLRVGDRVKFREIGPEEFDAFDVPSETAEQRNDPRDRGSVATPGIEVIRAGVLTTVQDLGRVGHRAQGVPLSGAADSFALRLANLLVGNPEDAAGLEFALVGPELRFLHDAVVAFTGAEFAGFPRFRPLKILAGTVLKLGAARRLCRGYLAVAGGIDVPLVLGSRSTYVRAALGGFGGRALRDGDVLSVPAVRRHIGDHWWIDERILPPYSESLTLRVLPGAHAEQFDSAWSVAKFTVSSHSDRMGVRLAGTPLKRRVQGDLVSSPVAPGTIQVPPDGQPIVLLADAQTIGGYPHLAHVISVDLPLVAQLRPGDAVQFQIVTLAEAHELATAQERALALLREGLAQKLVRD